MKKLGNFCMFLCATFLCITLSWGLASSAGLIPLAAAITVLVILDMLYSFATADFIVVSRVACAFHMICATATLIYAVESGDIVDGFTFRWETGERITNPAWTWNILWALLFVRIAFQVFLEYYSKKGSLK